MLSMLKNWMGSGAEADFAALVKRGAQIVDVRTPEEFRGGHIAASMNIPVQVLPTQAAKIRKDRPVITCCATGIRSATAKRILEAQGFAEVYNGSSWRSLQKRISGSL